MGIIMKQKTKKTKIYKYNETFELLQEYPSIAAAAKDCGVRSTSIYKCLVGQRNQTAGFFWYKGAFPPEHIPEKWQAYISGNKRNGAESKPLIQFSLSGEKINEYPSIRKASKESNIDATCISRAASGKNKTAGGYIWKFAV